ncbi:MAG: hypothetical protein M1830_010030 [Pleopsidium flavum]|nr:MAG: hypothetical protein M1830_010030 [Pleopsidium flavum]
MQRAETLRAMYIQSNTISTRKRQRTIDGNETSAQNATAPSQPQPQPRQQQHGQRVSSDPQGTASNGPSSIKTKHLQKSDTQSVAPLDSRKDGDSVFDDSVAPDTQAFGSDLQGSLTDMLGPVPLYPPSLSFDPKNVDQGVSDLQTGSFLEDLFLLYNASKCDDSPGPSGGSSNNGP